jgi:hypothetical protein
LLLVIFGYVGCTWLPLVLFGLLAVAVLSVLAGVGVLMCAGWLSQSNDYDGTSATVLLSSPWGLKKHTAQ